MFPESLAGRLVFVRHIDIVVYEFPQTEGPILFGRFPVQGPMRFINQLVENIDVG